MIVDTSAVVSVLRREPAAESVLSLLRDRIGSLKMSAATRVEAEVVVHRRQIAGLDDLLTALAVDIVPFDAEMAVLAGAAHRRFGKGSGSPARLNLGDTYSYALAKVTGEPLLFVGDDFTHTDVTPALTR